MGSIGFARGLILSREPKVGFYRVIKRTDTREPEVGLVGSTGLARGLISQENQRLGSTELARGLIFPREPKVGFYGVSKRTDTLKRTRGWVLQG